MMEGERVGEGRGGVEAVGEKVENIEKLKREKMREKGHRNAAEDAVRAGEWHEKSVFKYKQNGRRRLAHKELKQHFVSEYALFKGGDCPPAGAG